MIDAVIADYGTPSLAARCVGSLRSPLFSSIELVDAKGRGWSYAQAVNRSLERGTAPYVLALNADTEMLGSPDPIIDIFEQHPDVAVIGPRQIDDQSRITHAGIIGTNEAPQHRYWLRPMHEVAGQCAEPILDCVTVAGSVYFARRSVWEKHGGFLETRGYFEETALCYSVRHAGHRVVYTGSTTWLHLWHRGGMAELDRKGVFLESREVFRTFCEERGIACD